MKKIVIGLLALSLVILSGVSYQHWAQAAETTSASNSNFCYTFNRDLYATIDQWYGKVDGNNVGVIKRDIDALHTVLQKEHISGVTPAALAAKTYGTSTAEAVAAFQAALKDSRYPDIHVNGVFDGPTRTWVNNIYGCYDKTNVVLVSPNKKVVLAAGGQMVIKFNVAKLPVGVTARLDVSGVPVVDGKDAAAFLIDHVIVGNGNNQTYTWNIPSDLAPGDYKIQLQAFNGAEGLKSDISSQAFTIQSDFVTLSVPSNWRLGEANSYKFTLDRTTGSSPVSISAYKWDKETDTKIDNDAILLIPSTSAKGQISVSLAKAKGLTTAGSYRLEAKTTATGAQVQSVMSNVFDIVSPAIVVTTPTQAWIAGNATTVTITKSATIKKVSVQAIPIVDGERGMPTELVNGVTGTTIKIPKSATTKLASGTYELRVSSSPDNEYDAFSDVFTVNSPTVSLQVPENGWVRNVDGSFTLTKDKAIGSLSIAAVAESVNYPLLTNISSQGTIVVPGAKIRLIVPGTYKLEATTKDAQGNIVTVAQSASFTVANPVLQVETPISWSKGNVSFISIPQIGQGVGKVTITAIPQSGTSGGSVQLASSVSVVKNAVQIPKTMTAKLQVGAYKVEVKSTNFPEVVATTDAFQVLAPGMTIGTVTNPWKIGTDAKINLVKDSLLKDQIKISAVMLDSDGYLTPNEYVLIPNTTASGQITIPKAAFSRIPVGTYVLKAETNTPGTLVRYSYSDSFNITSGSLGAAVITSMSSALTSLLNFFK